MSSNDWLFDAIYQFFQSPTWQTPVQSFIEANCIFFVGDVKSTLPEAAKEQRRIHKEFTRIIDTLMQALLKDIGIDTK